MHLPVYPSTCLSYGCLSAYLTICLFDYLPLFIDLAFFPIPCHSLPSRYLLTLASFPVFTLSSNQITFYPENHVYAILEPPTLKSKWRPISTLLNGKESPTVCSTLPALRAPQPPTAPPPEDGVVTLISSKPDVTLCGSDAIAQHCGGRPGLPVAMMSSFRKQCYSPHEQEQQNRNSQVLCGRLKSSWFFVFLFIAHG